MREFLARYNGSSFPSQQIALNVLESMEVPRDRAEKTLDLIMSGADALGLLSVINGKKDIDPPPVRARTSG